MVLTKNNTEKIQQQKQVKENDEEKRIKMVSRFERNNGASTWSAEGRTDPQIFERKSTFSGCFFVVVVIHPNTSIDVSTGRDQLLWDPPARRKTTAPTYRQPTFVRKRTSTVSGETQYFFAT